MKLSRREMLAIGASAIAVAGGASAFAATDAIMGFTGGVEVSEGGITITAPEIAENGNTVPIGIEAPGAEAVAVYADGNPVPNVAVFTFGELSPSKSASTRVRLAKTQNVVAVAKMADGTYTMSQAAVKVTIGGCGG
ncbi:Sulfur oxidation protein SoxY [Candidatus Rhodobacter oscarellae]|uniref:Sulfur oxidation protein SoxY n=1 Tax=Candidatus Rhodobacter oscarellae TaxID=1675527 RepID=A0A0J9EGB2_9RHOB|nr:thiosulfate oxidation carrier protein SoxY [Candidatus Rhodobacter lobularis]KMW60704.1 Sulfur oxidation protein SoxY [Candidatus Rhodobacter lobularis]